MKFAIRDLLLLTVIVGLVVGWLVDHWRQSSDRDWLKARLAAETNGSQMSRDVVEALEKKLDEIKPGWRKPTEANPHGYYVLPGPRISSSNLPNSSAPAPNPPEN